MKSFTTTAALTGIILLGCADSPVAPAGKFDKPSFADLTCTGCGLEHLTLHIGSIVFTPGGEAGDPTNVPVNEFSCNALLIARDWTGTVIHDGDQQAAGTWRGRLYFNPPMPVGGGVPNPELHSPLRVEGEVTLADGTQRVGFFFALPAPEARSCAIANGVMRITIDGQAGYALAGIEPNGDRVAGGGPGFISGSMEIAPDMSVISSSFAMRVYRNDDPGKIVLTPSQHTLLLGTTHLITATVTDYLSANPGMPPAPVAGASVIFSIIGSGSGTISLECTTDAAGQCTVSYSQALSPGTDLINAFADVNRDGHKTLGEITAAATAEWIAANQPPVANTGGRYVSEEGQLLVFNLSGSDPDGDALTYTWDFGDGTTGTGSLPPANHTYVDDGTYNVSLQVTDAKGATHTANGVAVVTNAPPVVSAITAQVDPVASGGTVSVTANFADAGQLDNHSAYIAWGDGVQTSAQVARSGASGSASGTHVYIDPGVYTVTVTVSDDDGATATALYQYIVVYDPTSGFVTGGGWINSSPGAYRSDPSLSGKATFGFVSKYKHGSTVPTGTTHFEFKTGALQFHSTDYEWLVVSGPKAQYKGSGQIGGTGNYGFMLTVIDGAANGGGGVDRFRIKIWDKSSGAVLYDNQTNDSDAALPTTALGGGSIVIHR